MKPPFMIIRLWPTHHNDPATRDATLKLLKRHRQACDEVWLCTEIGYPSPDVHRASAARMAEAAAMYREAGIQPGIQIANTLGHMDMNFDIAGGDWQRMVGQDGTVARACHCPRAPAFLSYLRELTRAYAAWQPSSVWIDDDLRMNFHLPVMFGCFCQGCLSAFSKEQGRVWAREALMAAFAGPDGGELRAAWAQFGQESVAGVARAVGEAVRETAPACRLGFQHCAAGMYDGMNWNSLFRALGEASPLPLGSRPGGGGNYNDHAPRSMLVKALNLSRQVNRLPDRVTVICPEIENFTHTAMGKSAHGTAIESAWYLAQAGCNCLSYALLCSEHEDHAFYGRQLARLARWRPFYERFVAENAGTKEGGFDCVHWREHPDRPMRPEVGMTDREPAAGLWVPGLVFTGLPLGLDSPTACGAVLTAGAVRGLSESEVRRILSGGVLADGEAIAELEVRGWAELAGVTAERVSDGEFLFERFTDEPLNGGHGGHIWQQYAFGENMPFFRLQPSAPGARVLGEYVLPSRRQAAGAGIATLALETPLGGRLAVLGYNGWESTVSSARRAQFLSLADWVSHGKLPVILDTAAQVAVASRVTRLGRLRSVMLLNMSIDRSGPLQLRLRGMSGRRVRWIVPGQNKDVLLPVEKRKSEMLVTVPGLAPWALGYLLAE